MDVFHLNFKFDLVKTHLHHIKWDSFGIFQIRQCLPTSDMFHCWLRFELVNKHQWFIIIGTRHFRAFQIWRWSYFSVDWCVHPRLVLPRLVSLVEVALIEQLTKVPPNDKLQMWKAPTLPFVCGHQTNGWEGGASGFLLHHNVWKVKINYLFILWKAPTLPIVCGHKTNWCW